MSSDMVHFITALVSILTLAAWYGTLSRLRGLFGNTWFYLLQWYLSAAAVAFSAWWLLPALYLAVCCPWAKGRQPVC